jgi:cyclopropane fatty-acyl-phospholipid synthase-like methyltransferase
MNKFSEIYNLEDVKLLSLVTKSGAKILDVGCGQGRYLKPLWGKHDVYGIDASEVQVKQLSSEGYRVFSKSQVDELPEDFDYIIMSHIIEHIAPKELIDFFDCYLRLLKSGGLLLIATPLLYDEFYDDYDHIKPYTPKALQILFSDYSQQAVKTANRLELESLWIRKWPYYLHILPYESNLNRRLKTLIDKILIWLFWISQKSFGRKTGWVGSFRKI